MHASAIARTIPIILAALLVSSAALAQRKPAAKAIPKPGLPAGAKYLPQKEVFRRYGKTPEEAAARDRRIEMAAMKLMPDWRGIDEISKKGIGANQILRFRNGRELLILSGRSWSFCYGYPTALAYDIKAGNAAVLMAMCDTPRDCEIPKIPAEHDFVYYNKGLLSWGQVFSVLWTVVQKDIAVLDEDDVSSSCYREEDALDDSEELDSEE
jgi:hypothetical protein